MLDDRAAAVWAKGNLVPKKDPYWCRTDAYGNEIHRENFGESDSEFGWEFDQIAPQTLGADEVANLRPLNCRLTTARERELASAA
jgi:hypothetical protein